MGNQSERLLERFETNLHGIPVVIRNGVREIVFADGEVVHSFIDPEGMEAAVALIRALTPIRLTGREVRFMRKVMGLKLAEFAEAMGTAAETLSRWENDKQLLGGFAEKVLRELVCDRLRNRVPGIPIEAGVIVNMRIQAGPGDGPAELEPIELERVAIVYEVERVSRTRLDAWQSPKLAA